ncbi:zinc finger CCCH-type antiviral protein 1-like [Dendropsophus ebraccatus]|uniref:zinc finger CCCH-type antiviral protein 1-like n=1 Tax=Dendropsophus ebraccatus TaxID=150705 RepID=UPI003831BABB
MSDPTVTAFLTKVLCSHGGRMPRNDLSEMLELPSEQIEQILQDEPQKFALVGELVLARSPIRICPKYQKNDTEEECDKLHLCLHYLQGKCRRPQCTLSHDTLSDHNRTVLKANELSGLNEDEIKILLLQNDNQLLPGVCVKYLHDKCDLGKDCQWLHICGYFTRGECNRRTCKRSHHLLEFSSHLLLTRCHMSEESIQNFQMLCTVKHNERFQTEDKTDQEKRQPGAQRRRRGGRPQNRRMGNSQDRAQSKSRGQQQERTGFHHRGRSGSRPVSESGDSQIYRPGNNDCQINNNQRMAAGFPLPLQPLMSLGRIYPLPAVYTSYMANPRANIQPTLRLTLPKVFTPPGPSAGYSSSSSTPPVPKSTFTPVTTVGSVNPSPTSAPGASKPVYPPKRSPSDADFVNLGPPTVANPSTVPVPSTTPSTLVNSSIKGPSEADSVKLGPPTGVNPSTAPVPPTRPSTLVNSSIKGPSEADSVKLVPPTGVNPSTAPVPPTRPSTLVNSSIKGPSEADSVKLVPPTVVNPSTAPVPPTRPSTLVNSSIKGPSEADSVKLVPPTGVNPSTAPVPPTRPSRLVDSLVKGPSVPQKQPESTSMASPSKAQPIVNLITPAASPSSTPTSYPRTADSPTDGPSVQKVQPVQPQTPPATSSNKPQTSVKPISKVELKDKYNGYFLNKDLDDWVTINPSHSGHHAERTSIYGATYLPPKKLEPDKVPEICLSHLWKFCKSGDQCPKMHYYLPYRWQIYRGNDWEDISNMEEIEKSYCDPNVTRAQSIDFLTMTFGVHRVRRLSTVSSVTKPPEYVLTTEWLWYWKDEYGSWTQYGHTNVKQMSSTISSSDLENIYLSDPTAIIPFTAGNQRYEINFREMKQRNVVYNTEKDVRRRPRYLSFDDVKLLAGSTKSSAPRSSQIYPRTWDRSALPEIGCKKVPVSETSSEFLEIVSSFTKTVSGQVVKKLWRLQNPTLWQVFQWQKEQMKKENHGRDVKEMRLFHGTEKTHIDNICNENFDWRICGVHATAYGHGSYFARDAQYSHNYSSAAPDGTRSMFVARVLVGDYGRGDSQMRRPPQRRDGRYYDSCVNDITDPSIFVVFEKHQIYPEYLLEYEQRTNGWINW